MFRERVHVDHAAQHRATAVARLREHQIIDHALAQAAARNQQVLQFMILVIRAINFCPRLSNRLFVFKAAPR